MFAQARQSTQVIALIALIAVGIGVFTAVRLVAGGDQVLDISSIKSGTTAQAFRPQAVYQGRVDGVVSISSMFRGAQEPSNGAGFVYNSDGYIVTASHVVMDYKNGGIAAQTIYVSFASGDELMAKLVGVDQRADVAVLKVEGGDVALKPVPMGDSDATQVGDPVAVIGSPYGNDRSLTTGIVSAVHRSVPLRLHENSGEQLSDAIQTDAAVNPGNSGGPLLDAEGKVIGIMQQITSTTGADVGIAFAVPAALIDHSAQQLIAHGAVKYARIGVLTATVTPQLADEQGLPSPRGALVQSVQSGWPADGKLSDSGRGVMFFGKEYVLGDQIVKIAGVDVRSREDVSRIMDRLDPSRSVEVEFYRDGDKHTVSIQPAATS
jgi:S1-C subfamily serine protease